MINPTKMSVVIIANPDLRVAPDLILWLLDIGVPRRSVLVYKGDSRNICASYNAAVEMSITRRVEWCMFADCDIRPCDKTKALLATKYDIASVMSDTEAGIKSWSDEDSFHTALWVGRRLALSAIGGPWFQWKTNPSGSQVTGCVCHLLREKAKARGFTVGHSGYANHWPRGTTLPEAIPLLGSVDAVRRLA